MRANDQFHVGIVVDDLERSLSHLTVLFGYERGALVELDQPVHLPTGDTTVPFQFRYSCQAPRLEVIQSQPGTLWTAP